MPPYLKEGYQNKYSTNSIFLSIVNSKNISNNFALSLYHIKKIKEIIDNIKGETVSVKQEYKITRDNP